MQNARDVLTPDALAMLQVIEATGSFAAAARQLGLVPSALTYRVRQIEDALVVQLVKAVGADPLRCWCCSGAGFWGRLLKRWLFNVFN